MSAKPNPLRKANSNSRLKKLPEETQVRIAGWCAEDGLVASVSRCFAELQIVTNKTSLSEWLKWREVVLPLKAHFDSADAQAKAATELLKQVDPHASAEKLQAFGQLMFMQKAMAAESTEDFVNLGKLNLAGRELQAKIEGFKATYAQKERDFNLQREKFKRTTCELFLKWNSSEQARQIVGSGATNADKIEQLGRVMFGEDWDA